MTTTIPPVPPLLPHPDEKMVQEKEEEGKEDEEAEPKKKVHWCPDTERMTPAYRHTHTLTQLDAHTPSSSYVGPLVLTFSCCY